MAEVAAANAQQIQRKKQLAEQEKQEEACIAEYIRQKDAREQVRPRRQSGSSALQQRLQVVLAKLPCKLPLPALLCKCMVHQPVCLHLQLSYTATACPGARNDMTKSRTCCRWLLLAGPCS